MAFNYDKYLRTDKMPTLWCWGCGDGVILKALIRAIDAMGWDMNDVCVVSGIGCSGRFSGYLDCNTIHTTHGINVIVKIRPFGVMGATSVKPTVVKVMPAW